MHNTATQKFNYLLFYQRNQSNITTMNVLDETTIIKFDIALIRAHSVCISHIISIVYYR